MKKLFLTIVFGLGLGLSAFAIAEEATENSISVAFKDNQNWKLYLAHDKNVIYNGVVNFDQAGIGPHNMLYQANSAGDLFVGIFVHGLLAKGMRDKQKIALQTQADAVLSGYQQILSEFKYQDLIQRTIEKVSVKDNVTDQSLLDKQMVVENAPSYQMTQDQRTLVLNNLLIVHHVEENADVSKGHAIRVVSKALKETPSEFWHENNGENLKTESADLLAKSIAYVLADLHEANVEKIPFETVRYLQGNAEKIERAQVINRQCDRLLLKNLRGMLMSVPIKPQETCDSQIEG